jgi:hypothetical protein
MEVDSGAPAVADSAAESSCGAVISEEALKQAMATSVEAMQGDSDEVPVSSIEEEMSSSLYARSRFF